MNTVLTRHRSTPIAALNVDLISHEFTMGVTYSGVWDSPMAMHSLPIRIASQDDSLASESLNSFKAIIYICKKQLQAEVLSGPSHYNYELIQFLIMF